MAPITLLQMHAQTLRLFSPLPLHTSIKFWTNLNDRDSEVDAAVFDCGAVVVSKRHSLIRC